MNSRSLVAYIKDNKFIYKNKLIRWPHYTGMGYFKFSLETLFGETLWSNDGTTGRNVEPSRVIPLAVKKGFFSIRLGDKKFKNMMSEIHSSILEHTDVYLRVWFSADKVTFIRWAHHAHDLFNTNKNEKKQSEVITLVLEDNYGLPSQSTNPIKPTGTEAYIRRYAYGKVV